METEVTVFRFFRPVPEGKQRDGRPRVRPWIVTQSVFRCLRPSGDASWTESRTGPNFLSDFDPYANGIFRLLKSLCDFALFQNNRVFLAVTASRTQTTATHCAVCTRIVQIRGKILRETFLALKNRFLCFKKLYRGAVSFGRDLFTNRKSELRAALNRDIFVFCALE